MLKRHLSGWELKISSILFCPSLTTKIAGSAVFWLGYNYRRKLIEKTFGRSLREWLTYPIFSYLLYIFLVGHGGLVGLFVWENPIKPMVKGLNPRATNLSFFLEGRTPWSEAKNKCESKNVKREVTGGTNATLIYERGRAPCNGNIKKKQL